MDAETLREAMGCSIDKARSYVTDYNRALIAANCTTVNRSAMFAAQIGHESAGLRYMEEIASGAAYEGRRDLGNTQPGDGRRFKGRGPIQLTGRHNYGLFGAWCHGRGLVPTSDHFQRHPAEVATSRWGFLAASWYWTAARPKINGQCDAGDLVAVTRSINGGTNGLADRRARWDRCRRLGSRLLPSGPAHPSAPTEGELVATDQEKRQIADMTVDALIRHLLPNPYTQNPDDRMNVGDTLTWGTVHSARTLDGINAVLAKLGAVEAALGRVATEQPGLDPEAIRAVVREAIADSVQVTGDLTVVPR